MEWVTCVERKGVARGFVRARDGHVRPSCKLTLLLE